MTTQAPPRARAGATLPPGPRLPAPVQTALLATRPLEFLERAWRRHGDVFTVRAAPLGTTVQLASPAAVKQVFTGDPCTYHAGEASHSNAVPTSLAGDGGPNAVRSLLLLDEDLHLHDRRLMLPPFQGRQVQRYAELMRDTVAASVERWPVGKPFPLHAQTRASTLEIILRVVFGMDDSPRLRPVYERAATILDVHPLFVWAPWLRRDLGPRSPEGRHRIRIAEGIGLILEEIRERRAAPDLDEREDVLSVLLRATTGDGSPAFDDFSLATELGTLLLAGHETTASAIAWCFDRLLHHPHALERVREELDSGDDSYLDAVVRETLRTRPILVGAGRKLTAPVEIDGHVLAPGLIVRVAIALVHLRSELYPDPHAFRPERFLGGGPDASYSWIPFGGGVRHCIGSSFALVELKVTIAEILRRVELAPASGPDRATFRHMLLAPARGVPVVVVRRRSG